MYEWKWSMLTLIVRVWGRDRGVCVCGGEIGAIYVRMSTREREI